jgi:5-methylcytosine-specific restriction protein A
VSPKKPPTFRPPWAARAKAVRDRQYARPGRKVYDSQRWRRVRARVLNAQPLCEDRLPKGRKTPATEVDHIVPLAEGGAPYAFSNLAARCKACHSRKTAADVNARKLGSKFFQLRRCEPFA